MKKLITLLLLISSGLHVQAQVNSSQLLGQINTITTAVPFLMIAPDARAAGMGEGGIAMSPDANSAHWNASHLVFAKRNSSISVSYTPWLRALVPDINLAYVSGYFKPDSLSAISASVRYFSLGTVTLSSISGTIGQYRPFEMAADISYARRIAKRFSAGIGLRFIYSDISSSYVPGGSGYVPGRSLAGNISATWKIREFAIGSVRFQPTAGLAISNMGAKIWYHTKDTADFIPANLRLGSGADVIFDTYNRLFIQFELTKLLVPSPPIYEIDPATGNPKVVNGNYVIAHGRDPNRSVISGMLGSFNDAPGGFREELREINLSVGLEYWYNETFAVRAGYFYEHPLKGNRQFFTLGAGIRYNVFGLDFAYLIPVNAQRSPLQDTLRFTLLFNFKKLKMAPRPHG